jgi:hypothetical protein
MAVSSSTFNLRYPILGDTPNVPRDIEYLAKDTDRELAKIKASIASGGFVNKSINGYSQYWVQYRDGSGKVAYQLFARRAGQVVSVQGLVMRAVSDYTPPANPMIPILQLPADWTAESSQTGVTLGYFSAKYQPVRWVVNAGQSVMNIIPMTTFGTSPLNFLKRGDWVSCNFVYNCKAVTTLELEDNFSPEVAEPLPDPV